MPLHRDDCHRHRTCHPDFLRRRHRPRMANSLANARTLRRAPHGFHHCLPLHLREPRGPRSEPKAVGSAFLFLDPTRQAAEGERRRWTVEYPSTTTTTTTTTPIHSTSHIYENERVFSRPPAPPAPSPWRKDGRRDHTRSRYGNRVFRPKRKEREDGSSLTMKKQQGRSIPAKAMLKKEYKLMSSKAFFSFLPLEYAANRSPPGGWFEWVIGKSR